MLFLLDNRKTKKEKKIRRIRRKKRKQIGRRHNKKAIKTMNKNDGRGEEKKKKTQRRKNRIRRKYKRNNMIRGRLKTIIVKEQKRNKTINNTETHKNKNRKENT